MTTKKRRNNKIWWKKIGVLALIIILAEVFTIFPNTSNKNPVSHTITVNAATSVKGLKTHCYWKSINDVLYGGIVNTLAIDSHGTIYAGMYGGGVFKSMDYGTSWRQAGNKGLTDRYVNILVIDSDGTIYAGTGSGNSSGVFKSTDYGMSWVQMNNGLVDQSVNALVIDSSDAIYIGTSNGVFVSTDKGKHWTKTNLINQSVYTLAIDSNDVVYAGTYAKGVFKSTDHGATWKQINNGLTGLSIKAFAIDSHGAIYAGTYAKGVFKSTDYGATWEQTGLKDKDVYTLAIDSNNVVYAGTANGIFKSINLGTSWMQAGNKGLTDRYVNILVIDSDGTIYAGTSSGYIGSVFKSTDQGATWEQTGLINKDVYAFAIDKNNTSYIGTYGGGIFKSADYGTSWEQINKGLTNLYIYTLAVDAKGTVYAGTDGDGIFKSDDSGASWKQVNKGLTNQYVWTITVNQNGVIYAGTDGDGIFKSDDSGASWKQVNKGLTDKYIHAIIFDSHGAIYAGTYAKGVFKSTDNGTTWKQTGLKDIDVYTLAIDSNNVVYAGTRKGGLFKNVCTPIPPQNLRATVSNNSITLTWFTGTAINYPISGYIILRSTTSGNFTKIIATVDANTTQYTDKTVEVGKIYFYIVKAFDNQTPPNYSEPSNEVSIEIKDTIPPTITISSPEDGSETSNDSVNISGVITDDLSGIASVTLNGNQITLSSDGSFTATVNLTEGTNTITITAIDKAGNKATKTVTVTYTPPVQTIAITLQPDNPMMTVNGVQQEIDPGRGTKPVIIPKWSRTAVPIRAIVEALGGTIGWDPSERKVTINFNDTVIELWIDKLQAEVNGVTRWIDENNHDVRPIIINDRTMLPLRFVAESLGCTVNWDAATRTITITYSG